MGNNKTIDGVPLALIEEALAGMGTTEGRRSLRPKLSALLAKQSPCAKSQVEPAAQSELAALQEELAQLRRWEQMIRENSPLVQYLSAAEQRNAELVELLKISSELFWAIEDDLGAISASAVGVTRGKIDAALKPTESESSAEAISRDYPHGESFYRNKDAD